jgi:hypothetical protein
MPSSSPTPAWHRWAFLYLCTAAVGAFAIFGGGFLPSAWFAGWSWWQRLALILLGSPFLVVGYVLCAGAIEALMHALGLALKHYPLQTLAAAVSIAGLVYAFTSLFPH